MAQARPRGRRPAGTDTRGAIVAAARAEFSERGFEAASMRAVARRADVDPALVRHYFPDKGELFALSIIPPTADPPEVAQRIVAGGLQGLGGRLVTEVLSVWGADGGMRFRAAVGAMTLDAERPAAFVDYLARQVLSRVMALLPPDDAEARVQLAASQVMGLLVVRHVLRAEPLASMPVDQVARLAGPAIDRYLTEALDDLP
jgi:AcrR family transcriptional regulator